MYDYNTNIKGLCMKIFYIVILVFVSLFFNGCGGAQPQAWEREEVKKSLYSLGMTENEFRKVINLPSSEAIRNNHIKYYAVNKLGFNYNEYVDLTRGISSSTIIERKRSKEKRVKQQISKIANYEENYMNEYKNILKNLPEKKVAYIQPSNKKEPCKLYMQYDGNKWFENDESYKIFWDGSCKNGYASGLGREIEKADMIDKWGIAIYKNGKPTYYIHKDNLNSFLYEGINNVENNDEYGVATIINEKLNDIDIKIQAGYLNSKTNQRLYSTSSPFWNGTYSFAKTYTNFGYFYTNFENNDDPKNRYSFQFVLLDKEGIRNGWAIEKLKNGKLFTGEYINGKGTVLDLPQSYNQKADKIIQEIDEARKKAYEAQQYAQKVKKQYKKKICKDSVKVSFIDNADYKAICSDKKDLEILAKINNKLEKLTEAKIARLEKQRYEQKQAREEQHRQQLLALERQKLVEQQRANKRAEQQRDSAEFQQGMNNLTNQINNMTPKTYNLNVFHY